MTTPQSPLDEIQTAVYDRLSGDSELTTVLGAGVYDEVPEGVAYPYVAVGHETTENPDNTHDVYGRDCTITLHVWSEQRAYTEVTRIANRVTALLDHQPLALGSPHRAVSVRFVSSQTLSDPTAPHPRHVPMLFRVVTAQDG